MKKLNFIKISRSFFCIGYSILICLVSNIWNFDKIAKWFYLKDHLDYLSVLAFFGIGIGVFTILFTLLANRFTTKPLAIFFTIISAVATYFIAKYDVAIERSMIMNALNTDPNEVHSLLSMQMLPYFLFLILLPVSLILLLEIKFESAKQSFFSSLKIIVVALLLSLGLLYWRFDGIARAVNISKKYIVHSFTPVNYWQSFGSILQHSLSPNHSSKPKEIKVVGQVTKQEDLVVVLAVGETSRRKNFSIYGYQGNETNPLLAQIKNLHLLNGKARLGSTLYALPEILVKQDVALPAFTAKLGIKTSCYVNYTLYDNCSAIPETKVSNCGHGGVCYDEDVLPLLNENLKSYKSGYEMIVLHLGGGSHGPSYHERYPAEFQKFKPMCVDADVINKCTPQELYNAYDNTILYVDYVVSNIINSLDKSGLPYVFIYLSDHGESLLEDGRIFHGMPPGIKLPEEQSNIPLIVKSSVPIKIDQRQDYSQQDIFDSVLNLFSVESEIYDQKRSFIHKENK